MLNLISRFLSSILVAATVGCFIWAVSLFAIDWLGIEENDFLFYVAALFGLISGLGVWWVIFKYLKVRPTWIGFSVFLFIGGIIGVGVTIYLPMNYSQFGLGIEEWNSSQASKHNYQPAPPPEKLQGN